MQVADWYKAEALEIQDGKWAMEPLEGLCKPCGYGVDAILTEAEHEGKTQNDIVQEVATDRPLKAKILLLQDIQSGVVPKGFTACVVKTNNTVGMESSVECAAVIRKHFNNHKSLRQDPANLAGSSKVCQKIFNVINSSLRVLQSLRQSEAKR